MQQRELALLREYETAIVQRETEALDTALTANNARSESLARLGQLLRAVMRKLNGEDLAGCEAAMAADGAPPEPIASTSRPPDAPSTDIPSDDEGKHDTDAADAKEDVDPELQDEFEDDGDPETLQRRIAAAEWSLERESELARLERENEELRILLRGVLNESAPVPLAPIARRPEQEMEEINEDGRASPALSVPSSTGTVRPSGRKLGGPPGTVGPFGAYKMRAQLTGQ